IPGKRCPMGKSILVVGGSYFAGKVFVEAASLCPDLSVTILNRGTVPLFIPGVTEIRCDRKDPEALRTALAGRSFDACVDFCAYEREDVATLFSALPKNGLGHYVLISTVSIYAPTLDFPVTENARPLAGPQPALGPASRYGFDKWLCEYTAMGACLRARIPYTMLRPAIIYGKYNYAPRESFFFTRALSGSSVPVPEGCPALYSFLWVDDLASAILHLLESTAGHNRAFNLAGPELLCYEHLVAVISLCMGRRIETVRLPAAEIEQRKIPLPFPLENHLAYSGELFSRTFDFCYTPFFYGMEKTWKWFSQHRQEEGHGGD
ncbi:MAG: NAD-dependent epimerase/dehydratase family protein, partial [Thermodesulfobacteriota bacterium]